jgi:uncharacterized RDD family membrane protein YckC
VTTTGPGPGWFADPAGSGGQRYFDGTAWTEHVVPPAPPPPPVAPYPAYAVAPPGYVAWKPPWKGAELGRPQSGPGALAEPGPRLAARLVDGLLLLGVLGVLCGITIPIVAPHVGPLFPNTPADNGPNAPPPGIFWVFVVVFGCIVVTQLISIAYESFATARYGRTLGKAWLHIRPLRVDGSPVSGWRAMGRSALGVAVGLMSWIGLLDPLWCLWDERRQCLHDKVADTIVVNDPPPHDPTQAPPQPPPGSMGYRAPSGS